MAFLTRKDDHAGLGDWYPDPDKFPHGLKPLIDRVHALGIDFGLWVKPEMVNENGDLYRKHPDSIVIHFDGRPRTQARSQFVLNLAMPEVRAYVFGVGGQAAQRKSDCLSEVGRQPELVGTWLAAGSP